MRTTVGARGVWAIACVGVVAVGCGGDNTAADMPVVGNTDMASDMTAVAPGEMSAAILDMTGAAPGDMTGAAPGDMTGAMASATATITATQGGTITSADGRVTLVVPPGAVISPTTISIAPVSAAAAPADSFPPGIAYEMSPDGLQFLKPAAITFRFTQAELSADAPAFLGIDGGTTLTEDGGAMVQPFVGVAGVNWFPSVLILSRSSSGAIDVASNLIFDTTTAPSFQVTGGISHFSNVYSKMTSTTLAMGAVLGGRISVWEGELKLSDGVPTVVGVEGINVAQGNQAANLNLDFDVSDITGSIVSGPLMLSPLAPIDLLVANNDILLSRATATCPMASSAVKGVWAVDVDIRELATRGGLPVTPFEGMFAGTTWHVRLDQPYVCNPAPVCPPMPLYFYQTANRSDAYLDEVLAKGDIYAVAGRTTSASCDGVHYAEITLPGYAHAAGCESFKTPGLITQSVADCSINLFDLASGNSTPIPLTGLGGTYPCGVTANPAGVVMVTETSQDGKNTIIGTGSTAGVTAAVSFNGHPMNGSMRPIGDSGFAGVGPGGFIGITGDGVNWGTANAGTTNNLNAIVGGNNKDVVVVGDMGTIVFSSDEGGSFTKSASGTTQNLSGVGYDGTQYVAVGAAGTILTSPDGKTWMPRTSNTTADLTSVVPYNGSFYASGIRHTLITSTDGITWTKIFGSNINPALLQGVAYGNSTWVTVGTDNSNSSNPLPVVFTSPDGNSWTPQSFGTFPVSVFNAATAVAYLNNQFLAAGPNSILSSPDGVTWTAHALASVTGSPITGFAWGNNLYVAVSVYEQRLYTSTDGNTWNFQPVQNLLQGQTGIVFAGGKFVLVGGMGVIMTSPDGKTWTLQTSGTTKQLTAIASNGAAFVAAQQSGGVLTSPDGITWTARTLPGTTTLTGLAFVNGKWEGVGSDGKSAGAAVESTDGITWTPLTMDTSRPLSAIGIGNGTTLAVGGGSLILKR